MEFRILGSFEVVGSAGVLDLRGAKRRGLLACLVALAGQPMSTDRLVEELWGDGGCDGAARTVQTYVSQLRKLLRGEPPRLETRPGGYVLEVDPAQVDASRFERAVTAAGAEHDPARRLAVLDGALGLWRGRPLGEFTGAGWADREAARLEALQLQAWQHRYDTLLDLDRAAEAVAELETVVRARPLDEKLWTQFMLALYRSGRQADALSAYQQARRHLVDELGIEPGPELTHLEHRILDHDPTLASAHPRAIAGAHRGSAHDGTMVPTPGATLDDVFGRDAELASIARFLDDVSAGPRALLFSGKAGIGKTTLWRAALDACLDRSLRVLSTRAAQAEAKLSFTVLGDLLDGSLNDVLPALPDPQRRAWRWPSCGLTLGGRRRTSARYR